MPIMYNKRSLCITNVRYECWPALWPLCITDVQFTSWTSVMYNGPLCIWGLTGIYRALGPIYTDPFTAVNTMQTGDAKITPLACLETTQGNLVIRQWPEGVPAIDFGPRIQMAAWVGHLPHPTTFLEQDSDRNSYISGPQKPA